MRESEGDAAVGRNGLCQDCRRAFCVEFCFVFFLSFFLRRRRPIQLLSAAGGVEEPTGPGGGGGGGMKTAPRVNNRRRNSRVPTENKRFRLTVVDCGDHDSDGLLCHRVVLVFILFLWRPSYYVYTGNAEVFFFVTTSLLVFFFLVVWGTRIVRISFFCCPTGDNSNFENVLNIIRYLFILLL